MSNDLLFSIGPYRKEFDKQIVDLILRIQNEEAQLDISAADQPDIISIQSSYIDNGGGFWVAHDSCAVVGTVGLQRIDSAVGILKKFFVHPAYRGMQGGPAFRLYSTLVEYARFSGIRTLLLDTPEIAIRSHAFYTKAGFRQIDKGDLPVHYDYPDRRSLLFRLDLE